MMTRRRNKPLILKKLEAIQRRIRPKHPKASMINAEVAKRLAGYHGELKLDYYLGYIPNDYVVLPDITLSFDRKDVQFDAIIISRRAIFVIEVKNFQGTISFDPQLRQCFREHRGTTDGFDYPLTQTDNAIILLRKWLEQQNLSGLPIYPIISFAHAETIIKVVGERDPTLNHVTYVTSVPTKMMHIHDNLQKENRKLQSDIIYRILNATKEFDIDIMSQYEIAHTDIQTGVHCPQCQTLAMEWERQSWHCPTCQHQSKTAHHQALQDYQTIYHTHITNYKCRNFLHIQSRHIARRLLQNANYRIQSLKSPNWSKK